MNSDASPYLARFLAISRVALGLDMRPETPHPETGTPTDDPCPKAMRSRSRVDDSSRSRRRSRSVRHVSSPAPII
jgi:hypothetical protein